MLSSLLTLLLTATLLPQSTDAFLTPTIPQSTDAFWPPTTTTTTRGECGPLFLPRTTITTTSLAATSSTTGNYDEIISNNLEVLYRAAESKTENPNMVYEALASLESNMRTKSQQEDSVGPNLEKSLQGAWRLVFTTGTKKTQDRTGQRINYFPIKAIQTFGLDRDDPTLSSPGTITNSIYGFGIPIAKFVGTYQFDQTKRRVEFDFARLELFCNLVTLRLKSGQAAQVGAATGLGSDSNVELAKRDKRAFFNWISADDKIATARGGGGGLALWKRISPEDSDELPKKPYYDPVTERES